LEGRDKGGGGLPKGICPKGSSLNGHEIFKARNSPSRRRKEKKSGACDGVEKGGGQGGKRVGKWGSQGDNYRGKKPNQRIWKGRGCHNKKGKKDRKMVHFQNYKRKKIRRGMGSGDWKEEAINCKNITIVVWGREPYLKGRKRKKKIGRKKKEKNGGVMGFLQGNARGELWKRGSRTFRSTTAILNGELKRSLGTRYKNLRKGGGRRGVLSPTLEVCKRARVKGRKKR